MDKKRVLVVIDMQNDFIDGILGTREAREIVPNVVDRILNGKHDQVFYTMDTHDGLNYPLQQEGKKLLIPHCLFGTSGWELNPKVHNALPKTARRYSKGQFVSIHMARAIQNETFSSKSVEIEIVGVCTDICVISNALFLKSLMPEAEIVVHQDCCAGTTPDNHQAALDVMESCQITIRSDNED